MPDTEQTHEDLSWIAKEIVESNGEAVLLKAGFIEGLTDDQVTGLFQKARRDDYEKIMTEAKEILEGWHQSDGSDNQLFECRASLGKLRKGLLAVSNIDFFPVVEQAQAEALLFDMETIFRKSVPDTPQQQEVKKTGSGKTWVTMSNVYVDRMASAWLIKQFIDPEAEFKFVASAQYQPTENELRFDMVAAEYTHQGDLCTFEVLVQTFAAESTALQQMAKIIHDIDLKDNGFGLAETPGVQALFDGIVATSNDDEQRIARISTVLDGLFSFFDRKNKK